MKLAYSVYIPLCMFLALAFFLWKSLSPEPKNHEVVFQAETQFKLPDILNGDPHSAMETYPFQTEDQRRLFTKIIQEVRCTVCQNQSLADSNAPVAQDLRTLIYKMVHSGNSERSIIQFVVNQSGDFASYHPPFKFETVILWCGPFLLLGIGLGFVYFSFKRRQNG